ncbi:ankyrin repeat-containing domain protein [Aspergillus transmontanensis]|uniref:Ankyrin repeat-containing domain protein n=1 Tax=Aspergillus transmontanensis TaxID=1034304 RepID=A0A5N6VPM0_9EURO|nr:ankyrin repeat-containing domain protein [Aspergillus transmontanensis]
MSYAEFRRVQPWGYDVAIIDTDGSKLLEDEFGSLLAKIIESNDVPMLNQYKEKHPRGITCSSEAREMDPFFVACRHGSTDVLRVLLEHYHDNLGQTASLEERDIVLLNVACEYGQLETALFLLDSQPPLGSVGANMPGCETALLSAAQSIWNLSDELQYHENEALDWVDKRLTRSEQLIDILLDRGASVHDVTMCPDEDIAEVKPQPLHTVLGLAVSRAGYKLLKRLVDEGANVHTRQECLGLGGPTFKEKHASFRDTTALHYGSMFWNVEGVQALFDLRGTDVDTADMVSVRDSLGRLPLHWAAAGAGDSDKAIIREGAIVQRILDIFELLLVGNLTTINIQDNQGKTPLHYAVATHASGDGSHLYSIVKFLCEGGADASLQDCKGRTVLHILAFWSVYGEPMDLDVIDLLIAHGANINHADKNGITALHIMARNFRQVKAAQFLIHRGADVNAKTLKGDTPLCEAAWRGVLLKKDIRTEGNEYVTLDDRIKAQDAMMGVLQDAGGSLHQPNAAGKTARQLLEQKRASSHKESNRKTIL